MQIVSLLQKQLHIPTNKPLILSISGGVDSMVLLSMLKDGPFPLVVVHFNHLKREQSTIEKNLVESYCVKHDISFHYYTIKINQGNFHHQAHHLRLHYLQEVAKIHQTPYILTAHHLDDLFENILIKLTRGSNLLGYAGMQLMHENKGIIYIKPLLYTPKADIIDYAKKFNVSFLEDESNALDLYLRNRYRHAVVPIMKQENTHLLEQIKQYHNQVSQAFSYIRNETIAKLETTKKIDLKTYGDLPPALQDDYIAYLMEHHEIAVNYESISKIKSMLLSKHPNQSYQIQKDFVFIKSYKTASIEPLPTIKNILFTLKEGKNKIDNNVSFTFFSKSKVITENFTKLCYNKLAFPLMLRHRRDGDTLHFSYGRKKLKKLLIDLKIPMRNRDMLWVLTDQNNLILWVEDIYLNETLGDENQLYFEIKRG